MRRLGLGLFVIGAICFVASPLFALNNEMNRSSLQGLKGVKVLVEEIAPEVEQAGLAKEPLRRRASKKGSEKQESAYSPRRR